MSAPDPMTPRWPLHPHHEALLRELSRLVHLAGPWRFARGPVVGATPRDYPEPWDETRVQLGRVIARTLWHAHVDAEVVLDDIRGPAERQYRHLRETKLELVRADKGHIELAVSSIGNDYVAGIVAHEIGRAGIGLLAAGDAPFRSTEHGIPDAATGSIATIVLGLGVVAANAAHFDRSAGETIGQTAVHEHQMATAGGLDWQDLTFLLAVQATVRDDVLAALDTLRPSQAQSVAAWREILDDHEDELVTMLALGDVDAAVPATRPPVPRDVEVRAQFDEADLGRANLGHPVFRYYDGTQLVLYGIIGLFLGFVPMIVITLLFGPSVYNLIPVGVAMVLGAEHGRRKRLYRCATCRSFVTPVSTTCAHCGGTIAGDIKHPNDRLEAEEALQGRHEADDVAADDEDGDRAAS
jgi:hypothetical protein